MSTFKKFILPGNEIRPGVWEADEPVDFGKEYQRLDTIEVCEHRDLALVEQCAKAEGVGILVYFSFKEGSKCPRCNGVLKNGRWRI